MIDQFDLTIMAISDNEQKLLWVFDIKSFINRLSRWW